MLPVGVLMAHVNRLDFGGELEQLKDGISDKGQRRDLYVDLYMLMRMRYRLTLFVNVFPLSLSWLEHT